MLSGGQRKRVGLAQVLIRDPKILLMDEPFGPLDAQTRQIMGNLLLDLWSADRKAVLFVTHELEEAIALSDRVVIMSAGPAARIIGDWTVPLPRPRDIAEVRLEPMFHELHREIWAVLKAEVLKTYAAGGTANRPQRLDLTLAVATLPATAKTPNGGNLMNSVIGKLLLASGMVLASWCASESASRAGEGFRNLLDHLQGRRNAAEEGRQQQGQCSDQRELRRRERVAAAVLGEPAGRHQELRRC